MKKQDGARFKISKSRKRKFGETKPNFNQMVKEQCKRYEQFGEKKLVKQSQNQMCHFLILNLKKLTKRK